MRGWLMVFRCIAFCVLINHLKRLETTLYAFGKIAFCLILAVLEPLFFCVLHFFTFRKMVLFLHEKVA